jgi:LPXTG-motif cell wall-anchored protein
MKGKFKRLLAFFMTFMMVVSITPFQIFKPILVKAAATATQATATNLVNKILGPGITASNISFTGNAAQGATFTEASFMPFSDGIILSTGNAASVFQAASNNLSTPYGGEGDAALTSIYQSGGFTGDTKDAVSLQFTVTPTSSKLSFRYVFASEEYSEPVEYNDVFALYVGGQNVALLPNGNTVSIKNTKNTAYHIDNTNGSSIGFLGYTTEFSCEATVTPNTPITIKLVIADATDDSVDSAVFVKASSINFVAASVPVLSNVSTSANVGSSVSATSNKSGTLYLVPKGTYANKAALDAVSTKVIASCNANIATNISTNGLTGGIYQVYAVDSSNAISTESPDITLVSDTTPPTFTVSGNPTTWTNGSVTLAVAASDSSSGLNTAGAYSFDNGATWTTSSTKSFSTNQTVSIKVRDNNGNISSQNIVIDKIDTIAPTITVAGNPTTWAKGSVTLAVTSSDLGSGLNIAGAYSFDGGTTWTTSNSKTFSTNQTVSIKVKDNLDNISSQGISIDKIDNLAPSFTSITQTPTGWTANSVALTVNGATDNAAGLNATAYSFSTAEGVYNWQASNTSGAFSENQNVYVYVRDAVGNISTGSKMNISNIDTTTPNTPVIANAVSFTSDRWYNSNQTVTASFEATTGAAERLQYKLNYGAWTDGTTVTVAQEGINTLKFRVIDEIGRTSGEAIASVQIDKTLPTVTASDENYNFRNSNFNIIANYSDGTGSGIKTREYAVTDSAAEPTNWTIALATQPIAIEAEGQWYIHYKVTDEAGNSKTGYFGSYKLDKTNPTGTLNVEPYKTKDGIDYTRNQSVSISLTGNDNLSNVAQMRFANSMEALTSASWEAFSATKSNFVLSSGNGLKTVYYEVKDNAGNVSEVYSDSIYFDNVKPAVTISAPSQYVVKSGDVITYTATFTDNSKEFGNASIAGNDGIDGISFAEDKILLTAFGTINANEIIKSVEEIPGQPLKRLIKLTMPANMTGVGSINLSVAAGAAEDKAGNLSDPAISGSSFSIDNEAPSNQNSILTKDLYVKGGSVIKLDNTSVGVGGLESDSVRIAPAGYNGDYANTTTVTSTHGLSVYINAPLNEGEYYVYVVDSAENISSPSIHKIIVDNSGPLVTVSEPSKTVVKGDSTLEYTVTFAGDATLQSITDLFKRSKIALETTGTANATISIEDVAGSDRVKKIKLSNFTGNGSIDKLVIGADICRDIVANGSIEMAQATKIIIDTTIPEIPTVKFTKSNDEVLSKILNFVTFNTFWKEKIKVSINSSDMGGSNLSKIYYKTAEGDAYTALTPDSSGNVNFELPVGFKGNIWTYSEDEIGNVSAAVKSDGTISESSAPQITVNPSDFSSWSVDNLDIQVNVNDNEGLKEIRYTVDGTETVVDMVTGFTDKQVNKNFKIALSSDSPAHSIQIQAVDLAGNNAATYNATVKQDKTVPTISSVAGNPSNWTKDGVTLTVNASDAVSGLASEAYSFDGGITWQASSSKTYVDNTNGIVVKVKDTAGNIATYEAVNITKIDKTAPNTAVIANKDKYADNNWYNENQTITSSFTTTAGCSEKLQYKLDNGTWTEGQSVPVNVEGKHTVSFRVIDDLGRTSEEQTVKVNIDKTAPTNAKITMKDKTFASFLNTITFGVFFDETVKVDITADSNISGLKKIEYQKVSDPSKYSPEGTWTEGNSFSVLPDDKFVVYARITDNAGNYVIINSDGVIVDATKPVLALTGYNGDWSTNDVTVKVAGSDSLAGLKEVSYTTDETNPQAGTVAMTDGKGTITLSKDGQYKLTVKVKDSSDNEVVETINVKIDKTTPTISSVAGNPSNWTKDSVTLTVNASDAVSGLASEAYSFDGGITWQAANSKTFEENTNGIVVKVKDAAGNISTYDAVNITKIDKTAPNTAEIANKDKYADNNWYNENQTITANFTTTAGCSEKLQYKLDNGTWTDGQSVPVNVEGKHTVRFRVIDGLGRTSEEQVVKVNIDKTAPTAAKITMKDKTFTSFLNKMTFGLFFDETVKVDITADSNISGVKKVEYQKVSDASKYSPEGTWTEGNSFNVVPDDKFVVYARITDNAGNYVIINSDGVIVDATKPVLELTEYPNGWSSKDITLNVASSDSLAGLKEVTYTTDEVSPQAGTVAMTDGKGTITLVNEGQYKLTVKAKDNSNNELINTIDIKLDKTAPTISSVAGNPKDWTNGNVTLTVNASDILSGLASEAYSFDGGATWQASNSKTYAENANAIVIKVKDAAGNIATYDAMNITKIDKTTPLITGATEGESYFIGRVINLSDDLGEVGVSTYKNGTGVETPFKSGDLFDKPGTYTLSLKDKGGNVSILSFEIKALPEVKDVLYTPDSKKLIEDIRAEFNKHNDLPEPYKTITDKRIKDLEERYAQLDKEVSKMKADTEAVLKGEQGLVIQREQIKALLDTISKLTAEQQDALKQQIEKLKAALQAANDKLKDLDADADSLSIVYAQGDSVDSVTKALYLTKSGKNGSVITWSSSDIDRISNAGRVNRPEPEAKDLSITLTASLRDPKTNEVITKQFKLILKKLTNQEAANEAARQLTVETALSFDSSGDNWESVTNRFLLLSKGAYNSTISWESNKPSTIAIGTKGNEVTGSVTRPEEVDESVIITATINKNGAIATKTFLIIVKQKKVIKQPISVRVPTETNATIVSDSNGTPVYVNIKRTTFDDNAGIIDTLIVTEQSITALTDNIDPLAQNDARTVVINMQQPTDGTSKADEHAVEIPAAAVQAMAERNAILEVKMDTVMIKLDTAELREISNKGTDLYFKVVPIKDSTEQSKLSASTKANDAVIEIVKSFGDSIAVPQGVPYTVETNYSGVNTRLLVPFTGITIPTENRDAFLDSLRVYIEHTDGTKEAKSGTIVYENGVPIGIEITIDRFSSFQIFSVEKPKVEVTIPKTGSVVDFNLVVIGGILLSFTGVLISRRKNKKSK